MSDKRWIFISVILTLAYFSGPVLGDPVPGQEPRGQMRTGARAPSSPPGAQKSRPTRACCQIIAIDSAKGLVTAKETATNRTFQFAVSDRRLLASLQMGGPVYANYQTKQVSLDGKNSCCDLVLAMATPNPAVPAMTLKVPVKVASADPAKSGSSPAGTPSSSSGSGSAGPQSCSPDLPCRGKDYEVGSCTNGTCKFDCRPGLTRQVINGVSICVNLQTGPYSCGSVGTVCGAGSSLCSAGTCVPLSTGCGALNKCAIPNSTFCVNMNSDALNCGGCGRTCQYGENCVGGNCR